MTTISGSPPRGPSAVGQAAPVQATATTKPSFGTVADTLARGLAFHMRTRPQHIKDAHVGFRNALGSEAARARLDRCIQANYPDMWKAIGEGKSSGGWSASTSYTETAANWCGEALIQQRRKLEPEAVKANYAELRSALASDKYREGMDRYLVSCDRSLARELEIPT